MRTFFVVFFLLAIITIIVATNGMISVKAQLSTGMKNLVVAGNNASNIYEVWQQDRPQDATSNILIRYTLDGKNFTANMKLSNYTDAVPFPADSNAKIKPPKISENPQLAVFNNTIHVVWVGIIPDNERQHIFYTNSTDYGKTFTSPVDISLIESKSYSEPRLFMDKNTGDLSIVYLTDTGAENPCRHKCG